MQMQIEALTYNFYIGMNLNMDTDKLAQVHSNAYEFVCKRAELVCVSVCVPNETLCSVQTWLGFVLCNVSRVSPKIAAAAIELLSPSYHEIDQVC